MCALETISYQEVSSQALNLSAEAEYEEHEAQQAWEDAEAEEAYFADANLTEDL